MRQLSKTEEQLLLPMVVVLIALGGIVLLRNQVAHDLSFTMGEWLLAAVFFSDVFSRATFVFLGKYDRKIKWPWVPVVYAILMLLIQVWRAFAI